MTIAIDCRYLDSSGIGVYIRGCLPYFLDSGNILFLIGDSERLRSFASGRKNVEVFHCLTKTFSFRELFFFPRRLLLVINKADLFYSPFFNIPGGITVPVFTTIHDIIFPDFPELTSRFGLTIRMFFYRRAFRLSQKIFTVSEFSKSRIEHYSRGKVPVRVTHSAIQSWILADDKINSKKEKFIIFIGNVKKHKGLDLLLDAFYLAKKEGLPHKLVIIGSKVNFRTSDNSSIKRIDSMSSEDVEFTGFISDKKLAEYLRSASLLVQPSLYEGFGLPPLEAMVLGTRALISDIQVFKEIYADFPVDFFRMGDVQDLKEKIISLLLNQILPPVFLSECLKNRYTFEKTAAVILKEIT